MKRRLISLLLALCMISAMLPDTAFAATKVNKIVITMSNPKKGQALPTDAKVPATVSTRVTSVKWKGDTDNGKAKENVKYTVTITVEIKSGVNKTFASKASSINATVNGKKASVKRNSSTKVTVSYTFPALSGNSGETSENTTNVIDFGVTHEKEDLNARWAALKPANTGKELYKEEPQTIAPYRTGKVRRELLEDAVNTLNFTRYVAGLNADVALDDSLNDKAQHGAVLLAAINELVHKPSQPGDMDSGFFKIARTATENSNLYQTRIDNANTKGMTPTLLSGSVAAYLSDQGLTSLGHRLWVLAPAMKKTGFGLATGSTMFYGTMEIEDVPSYKSSTGNFDAILWPAAGYHPTDFFQNGTVWSVQLNRFRFTAKSSDVKVKVTNPSGETQTCKSTVSKWGNDTIIKFTPSGKIENGNKFDVEISGIMQSGKQVVFKYSVEFFKLNTKGTSDLDFVYLDKILAEEALALLEPCVSNYTKAEDVLACVRAETKYTDTVEWVKQPTITKSTSKATGSIKGTLKLSRGSESFTLPVKLTLPKLTDQKNDMYAAVAAVKSMTVSNSTTKAQVQAAVNAAVPNGNISVGTFQISRKATETETGRISILLKASNKDTFGVFQTIPVTGGRLNPAPVTPKPTPSPIPTTAPGATPVPLDHDDILDLIHDSPSMLVVDNNTTEETLAASLQELLPKDSGYTFTVIFTGKNNATTTKEGLITTKVIFNDLAYNYSSFGETVLYHIPATGASDPEEVKKIEADVALIKDAFDARIASSKSKDDLKKADLLKIAQGAVKNGSSVYWLNDPLFSTMSAKDGKDGYVRGTLRVEYGAERRDVKFSAILHLDGTITNANPD